MTDLYVIECPGVSAVCRYGAPGSLPEIAATLADMTVECDGHVHTVHRAETVYPRINALGQTVWACCESSIGPKCQHVT